MHAVRFRNCRTTIALCLIALIAYAVPSLTEILQLDFVAAAQGQWWRVWTGHLTHYDASHLFWDLLMFAVLGAACERRHRGSFPWAVALMAAGISAVVALCCDSVSQYRGLSGIDTGLFAWFVLDQCRDAWRRGDITSTAVWTVPIAGLVGKLLFETATGRTLFVDASSFVPLVESHLAGVALGIALSCVLAGNGFGRQPHAVEQTDKSRSLAQSSKVAHSSAY